MGDNRGPTYLKWARPNVGPITDGMDQHEAYAAATFCKHFPSENMLPDDYVVPIMR